MGPAAGTNSQLMSALRRWRWLTQKADVIGMTVWILHCKSAPNVDKVERVKKKLLISSINGLWRRETYRGKEGEREEIEKWDVRWPQSK